MGQAYHFASEASVTRSACVALFLLSSALFAVHSPADEVDDAIGAYERGDYATALRVLRPFAEDGSSPAQFAMGAMFMLGDGVSQDLAEAAKWFLRCAEQGDADAQYALGALRDPGGAFKDRGEEITQDYAEAATWYRRAANQGDASAQLALGGLYMRGNGVPMDVVQAHMWCDLAAKGFSYRHEAKHQAAVERRDEIAEGMTRAQRAEARRLAREWRPKLETQAE